MFKKDELEEKIEEIVEEAVEEAVEEIMEEVELKAEAGPREVPMPKKVMVKKGTPPVNEMVFRKLMSIDRGYRSKGEKL